MKIKYGLPEKSKIQISKIRVFKYKYVVLDKLSLDDNMVVGKCEAPN